MSMTFEQINERLHDAALKEGIPLSGDFELTPRCNLNCVMCYVRKSPGDQQVVHEELSAKAWLSIAKQARDAGMLYTLLTGGEIFVRKDIREIYEGMVQLGLIITLYTNGTMITEAIADWIAKAPPRKVSITLYGASPDTYEKITGHRDGLERALKVVDMLVDRKVIVELKTIMIKESQADIIPLFEYAFKREIHFGVVNYICPARELNDADPVGQRLESDKAVEVEKMVLDYINMKVQSRSKTLETSLTTINPDEAEKLLIEDEQTAFRCTAGKTSFSINWRGKMIPCALMSDDLLGPSIDCHNTEFLTAWKSLVEQTNSLQVNPHCSGCDLQEHCMTCPARVYAETRSFLGKPEYLCKSAEVRKELYK